MERRRGPPRRRKFCRPRHNLSSTRTPHIGGVVTYRPEQARLRAHCLAAVLLILIAAANYGGGPGMHASLLPALALPPLSAPTTQAPDPLPSWNESASKKAITDFVSRVTRQDGSEFVPAPERIATFDNDGTLWSEQPIYFQVAFALDRVKALAPQASRMEDDAAVQGRARRRCQGRGRERRDAGYWRSWPPHTSATRPRSSRRS